MFKIRLPILFASAAVVLAAILVSQAYNPSGSAEEIGQSNSDQGDIEHSSIMPPRLAARIQESSHNIAGSDWIERHPTVVNGANRYSGSDWIERHPNGVIAVINGAQAGNRDHSSVGYSLTENGHTYAGTGDPLRYPARLFIPRTAIGENGHTYSGTGDPPR